MADKKYYLFVPKHSCVFEEIVADIGRSKMKIEARDPGAPKEQWFRGMDQSASYVVLCLDATRPLNLGDMDGSFVSFLQAAKNRFHEKVSIIVKGNADLEENLTWKLNKPDIYKKIEMEGKLFYWESLPTCAQPERKLENVLRLASSAHGIAQRHARTIYALLALLALCAVLIGFFAPAYVDMRDTHADVERQAARMDKLTKARILVDGNRSCVLRAHAVVWEEVKKEEEAEGALSGGLHYFERALESVNVASAHHFTQGKLDAVRAARRGLRDKLDRLSTWHKALINMTESESASMKFADSGENYCEKVNV